MPNYLGTIQNVQLDGAILELLCMRRKLLNEKTIHNSTNLDKTLTPQNYNHIFNSSHIVSIKKYSPSEYDRECYLNKQLYRSDSPLTDKKRSDEKSNSLRKCPDGLQKSKTSNYLPPSLPNSYKSSTKMQNKNNYKFVPVMNKSNTFHLDRSKKHQLGVGTNSSRNGKQFNWIPVERLFSWNNAKVDSAEFFDLSPAEGKFSIRQVHSILDVFRQQQQESYKQQKEMDDMLRDQEKKFVEKQREMESRLRVSALSFDSRKKK